MTTVTVDTNVLPLDDLIDLIRLKDHEVFIVSVTERELRKSDCRLNQAKLRTIRELAVIGESEVGACIVGSGNEPLEAIIQIVSNGSFPKSGKRGDLSAGCRRQLRDAMILEAHAREGRDIFVTTDRRGFIDGGRREALGSLLKTRILTREEYLEELRGS